MRQTVLPNGNLALVLEAGDQELVSALMRQHPDDVTLLNALLQQELGGDSPRLHAITLEDGLAAAPVMTDQCVIDSEAKCRPTGAIWWFAEYERTHLGEDLLEKGRAEFTRVPPGRTPTTSAQRAALERALSHWNDLPYAAVLRILDNPGDPRRSMLEPGDSQLGMSDAALAALIRSEHNYYWLTH